jgi:hypothetical protein
MFQRERAVRSAYWGSNISVLIQANERRKEWQVKGMWLWKAKGERAEKPAN